MTSDFELIDRWRDGDRAAGNDLLKRYFDSLYRFFRNKVDDGIDDLIQQTLLATVKHRDRFKKQASFRTYIFVVARNELYRHFRKRRSGREAVHMDAMSVADLGTSPSTRLAKRQEERLLLEALRRIPLELQVTLELFYWERLNTAEMAEALEIPRGTVKSRMRRARQALDASLRELAESAHLLESTLAELDDWADAVRAALSPA